MPALIVFSNRRWGSHCQRPRQLLSRLARRWPVLYVEEPVQGDGAPCLVSRAAARNLEVLTPVTPLDASGFSDPQLRLIEPLLAALLRARRIEASLCWFYDPMAWPLARSCKPRLVVYDCIDEPRGEPARQKRERALLASAGLVLTAGPALYATKRRQNANVVCLPSAVDALHFAPARLCGTSAEREAAERLCEGIGTPRLGYFGLIDSRLDFELIAQLADARAGWQITMAGPLAGIDATLLPRRPNLHWLGEQPYARLPHLMARWELALMPFVVNARTEHLNPGKTLEYMAGEKPIVSTALPDVVALHGGVVQIAHDAAGFVTACEKVIAEPRHRRSRRVAEMLSTVSCASWERSAASIASLIERELRKAAPVTARAAPAAQQPIRLQSSIA